MAKKHIRKEKTESKNAIRLFIILVLFTFYSLFFLKSSNATEISSVDVKIINNEIYVSTSLLPDKKFFDDLNNGLSKEITFFIDLFRVWKIWPDEFVSGVKITRILKSDNIKQEFVLRSISGNSRTEKRFRDVDSMVEWALIIKDLKLLNVKDFDKGEYYIKITVESNIRKLPPVIGYFLFFIPEKEFSVSKKSMPFRLGKDEDI